MDTQPLLPLGLAARYLRVPARWLRTEAEAGRIPHLPADTTLLFDLPTVEALLISAPPGPGCRPHARGGVGVMRGSD